MCDQSNLGNNKKPDTAFRISQKENKQGKNIPKKTTASQTMSIIIINSQIIKFN